MPLATCSFASAYLKCALEDNSRECFELFITECKTKSGNASCDTSCILLVKTVETLMLHREREQPLVSTNVSTGVYNLNMCSEESSALSIRGGAACRACRVFEGSSYNACTSGMGVCLSMCFSFATQSLCQHSGQVNASGSKAYE